MDAFDADVLIYAAIDGHPLGRSVRALFGHELSDDESEFVGIGSTILLPEVLSKPLRDRRMTELAELGSLLGRLRLLPLDAPTADLAVTFGARYGLRAADAAHLATAVHAGADRFITNNVRDFTRSILEIDIAYPTDLPVPRAG